MRNLFIFMGLLHLCGSTFGQECNKSLLKNWDFPGSDIQELFSPDAEHCQLLCTQHASCQFFAFIGPDASDNRHYHCFLKSTASGDPIVKVSKQGTTSGYSLRNCHLDAQPCLPRIYENVNFPGSDYKYFFTADHEECQRACTNDPLCQFFSYCDEFQANQYRLRCYLKFSWTVLRTPAVVANNDVTSGFSHKIQQTPNFQKECRATLFPNVNIPGSDMEVQPAASPEQCWTLCSAHPSCTYFSYVSDKYTCYLKNNPGEIAPTAAAGIISGMPSRFCQLDTSWTTAVYKGLNFPGYDIRNFPGDCLESCQKSCNEEPTCQFYSYVASSRLCYLKRVITLPAPPTVNTVAHIVSGFSLRNCHKNPELEILPKN